MFFTVLFLRFFRQKQLIDEFKPFVDELKEHLFKMYDDEILSKTHRYRKSIEELNPNQERDLMKIVLMFLYCLSARTRSRLNIFTMNPETNMTLYDTIYDAFMQGLRYSKIKNLFINDPFVIYSSPEFNEKAQ